jgi:hypothetical protein
MATKVELQAALDYAQAGAVVAYAAARQAWDAVELAKANLAEWKADKADVAAAKAIELEEELSAL